MRWTPALLALITLAPNVLAQEGELDRLVIEEAARAAEAPLEALWTRALALRDAEDLGAEGELDHALDRLLAREDVGPHGLLLASAARLLGDAPEPGAVADALRPLFEADDATAAAAVALLANDAFPFRLLERDARDALGRDLVAVARDPERSPETRMAFASAAARVGRGTEMRQARDEMRAFLSSSDPELRALGGLALAETGVEIEDALERELEQLAALPGARGRLASAYLKQERIRDLEERKYADLKAQVDQQQMPESLRRIQAVQRMITGYHLEGGDVTEADLTDAALEGMLRYMDEHSSYFPPDEYAQFLLDLEAEYGGIGAYVGIDERGDKLFTINRPIYSGPAYRAGLATDDKIVRIDRWPTVGEPVDEVIKRLKGKPGTEVKLYVWRRGMDPDLIDRPTEDMAVVLTREDIHIPAVASQMLPGGIGMVEVTTFSREVSVELKAVFQDLQAQGMRALVLDLRRNSGGLLTEARNVADLFLPRDKKVVTTEGTIGRPEVLRTLDEPALPEDLPIVVLTSRFTASASEIVAGALQDLERATILGERTFGKGSVQQLLPVLDIPEDEWEDQNQNGRWDTWETVTVDHDQDGAVDYRPRVKMTIARYLLPNGRSIHREIDADGNVISEGGIAPDVEVNYPLIDGWRFAERRRVQDTGRIKDYVSRHWSESFELFRDLAVTDLKDESRYPEFDRLMVDLETTLPRGDVRMLVRAEVRRRIQDDRGAEFPIGDFQEDYQVQRAIDELLKRFDEAPAAYEPYSRTFLDPEEVELDHVVAATPETRDRVRDAEALIREMRETGRAVTRDELDAILRALGTTDAGSADD